jgi:hypothetical protein
MLQFIRNIVQNNWRNYKISALSIDCASVFANLSEKIDAQFIQRQIGILNITLNTQTNKVPCPIRRGNHTSPKNHYPRNAANT